MSGRGLGDPQPDSLDSLDMAGAHIRAALAFTEGKLVANDRAQTATNDLNAALDYIENHRLRSEAARPKTGPELAAEYGFKPHGLRPDVAAGLGSAEAKPECCKMHYAADNLECKDLAEEWGSQWAERFCAAFNVWACADEGSGEESEAQLAVWKIRDEYEASRSARRWDRERESAPQEPKRRDTTDASAGPTADGSEDS